MDPFLNHLFGLFYEKRREGKGVLKVAVRKVLKKSVKSMVFRVRLLWPDQGPRSRGLGRF